MMGKLNEYISNTKEKWKDSSKNKKLTVISLISGIIFIVIILLVLFTKTSYETLFANMDPQDSGKVIQKLDEDKIKYKVDGNKILVPKDQVDKLRLSILSGNIIPSSHQGFEIFDNSNMFGVTDTEAKVMYQRALSGEIAKTIESIECIEKATVNLVLPTDSVFATEKEEGSASILVKLKLGYDLTPEQTKAIVALVSRSVKNLPKENVEILDQYGNLLSELIAGETNSGVISTPKQMEQEKLFETKLQNDTKAMLEKIFGRNKVAVSINADLDFDSKQITTIKYDPEKVEVSVHKKSQTVNDGTGSNGGTSPVDDNMSNKIDNSDGQTSTGTSTEETINYEVGSSQEVVVKAPGEVRKLSVSVVVDGVLNQDEKEMVSKIVAAATGISEARGDILNIEAIPFNNEEEKKKQELIKEQQKKDAAEKKLKLYVTIGGSAFGGIILLILVLSIIKKMKANRLDNEVMNVGNSIDYIVSDNNKHNIQKQGIEYQPVLEEDDSEVMDIEKEIRNYSERKPDQVAEVIRTWLSDDER